MVQGNLLDLIVRKSVSALIAQLPRYIIIITLLEMLFRIRDLHKAHWSKALLYIHNSSGRNSF